MACVSGLIFILQGILGVPADLLKLGICPDFNKTLRFLVIPEDFLIMSFIRAVLFCVVLYVLCFHGSLTPAACQSSSAG